jgi:hypothetical protein
MEVRAVVASTIAKPATVRDRLAHRFGLIEHALAPFTLIDLCGLAPDDAIASLVSTARRTTEAAVAAIA